MSEGSSDGLVVGSRLGEWVLDAPLGKGGYAEVWRAKHNALAGREVAIKIPHDPAYAAALREEGVLQDRLQGEHIVEVLGLDPDHDPPYLVVQLIEGTSLRDKIEAGRIEPAEVVCLLDEVCQGLEVAHAKGVVHRDLKPENVLLDAAGKAYVADFGLGLVSEALTTEVLTSGSLRTSSGKEISGTLRYMSPEQRDPEAEVDPRSDLYALGVMLFEMLTGEAPCGGEVPSDVIPGLDPRFDALFRKLCVRLSARYGSAAEVRRALAPLLEAPSPAPQPARVAAVPAGLVMRAMAFAVDALPFLLLAMGPLKGGRAVLAALLFVAYDVLATTLTGRTIGKFVFGLRVAARSGEPADATRVFLRQALRVLSLGFLGLGYAPALVPGQPTVHDLFAGTQVVHD